MLKKLLVVFLESLLIIALFFIINPRPVQAARTISDDLYVGTPKIEESKAIDISASTGNLIIYSMHGLGNQLLGYQYRADKDGYIIYAGSNPQRILKSNTDNQNISSEKFGSPINSFTEFEDQYIWDIKAIDAKYYSITNRKTGTCYTTTGSVNNDPITLQPYANKDTQKFSFSTMNGVYKIKSYMAPNMVWDIEGGSFADRRIISYPDGGANRSNQQWLVLYKPNNNGYVISNEQNKQIIITQPSLSSSPMSMLNVTPYNQAYSKNSVFSFIKYSETSDRSPVVKITSDATPSNWYAKTTATSGISPLYLQSNSSEPLSRWIFEKIGDIPIPSVSNLVISESIGEDKSSYYVGEPLTISGDLLGKGFKSADLYSRFDLDEPVLNQKEVLLDSQGQAKFTTTIDTSKFKEGNFYLDFFIRADGMYQSNVISTKYKLVYPTPIGKAVPQRVILNTPLSSLKASDFVTDLSDEIGSAIEVVGIENLDTGTVGEQTAIVSIKNPYKTTKIEVPVTVYKPTSNVTIQFQKDNQAKTVLHTPITIVAYRNEAINVLENDDVAKIVTEIQNEVDGRVDYTVSNQTDLNSVVIKDTDEQELTVKFSGYLGIGSIPAKLNFVDGVIGKDRAQEIPVKTDKDIVMTVRDSRGDGHGSFSVKAKLASDLYNVDKPDSLVIGSAIKLRTNKEINAKDFSTIITTNDSSNATRVQYDYTLGKVASDDPKERMKLLIPRWSVKEIGDYTGTVVWQIENGP